MPGLTTTGKNLYNKEIHQLDAIMGANMELYYATDYIPVLPNTTYSKSNSTRYELYDINKTFLDGANGSSFTTTSNTRYVRYNVLKTEIDTHQLEQSSTTTTYEPYQSNILTVNEDVTLRGIGDTKDELDCLTGELTKRVGEVVLDGTENWSISNFNENNTECVLFSSKISDKLNSWNIISDKFKYADTDVSIIENIEGICKGGSATSLFLNVSKTKASTVEEFKNWLSNNNVTLQYQCQESIKTVELLVQNQDGKTLSVIKPVEGKMVLSTSSDKIKPLFSGEIPVEAITQNLNSFIEEE